MGNSRGVIEADFDRIALLPPGGYDHNVHYHPFLLRELGPELGEALEIGCGSGQFSRLMAARAEQVLGVDLSANMIAAAQRESAGLANVRFERADILSWEWPCERFDSIASIATLHHLPMEILLEKVKTALRPGGRLVVLDICDAPWWVNVAAVPWSVLLRVWHTGRLTEDAEARRLWAEHGKTDRYLSVQEMRRVCARLLPGAQIRRHLLWRYSLVWLKKCVP
jgi:SAM-dependent methyltransferase